MDYRQHILDAIEDMPGISSGDLMAAVKERAAGGHKSNSPIRAQRDALQDDGYIVRVDVPGESGYTRHAWFLSE